LGWTLNPGAINRSISGFPDDHEGVNGTNRKFWEGGVYKSKSVGVTIGMAGSPNISANLSHSSDTYMGVSSTSSLQIGNFGISHSSAQSDFNSTSKTSYSVGIGISSKHAINLSTSGGNGIEAKYSGASPEGIGSSFQSMGLSMATLKNFATSKLPISAKISNSKDGSVSTHGRDFSLNIPFGKTAQINLSSSYKRYWIDESETTQLYGSMFMPATILNQAQIDSKSFDTYDLPVVRDLNHPQIDYSEEFPGGSFLDYDIYSVSGQGIGGSMRPYHFKSSLYRQTKKKSDNVTIQTRSYAVGSNPLPTFRFEGEFSNRYENNNSLFQTSTVNSLTYNFNAPIITGESGSDGYNLSNNNLAGSRAIKWYTCHQIADWPHTDNNGQNIPATATSAYYDNFIKSPNAAYTKGGQIGGFKITNESGVTYHYALPAYSYDEYGYTGRVDNQGKYYFNHFKKTDPYAYAWLLTAVTGPDFVDRNANGFADTGDWGYWITFEYGQWSDKFGWRNPSEGFNKDIDRIFDSFSKGKKDVYYLNYIRSASHTAVFVKELRLDGKGATSLYPEAVRADGGGQQVTYLDNGSFSNLSANNYPVSSLKLKEIYLFKNEDVTQSIASLSNVYNHSSGGIQYHLGSNVVDSKDFEGIRSVMVPKSLEGILFETTNDNLCQETSNSFLSALDVQNTTNQSNLEKKGKLSLTSLTFLGKGGSNLIPSTRFDYDLQSKSISTTISRVYYTVGIDGGTFAEIVVTDGSFYNSLEPGDIVSFEYNQKRFVGPIKSKTANKIHVRIKSYVGLSYGPASNLKKTKNPHYDKDSYDIWGFYKSDYNPAEGESDDISRRTTSVSAKLLDAWSLRGIKNAVGSEMRIDYEADTYKNVLKPLTNLEIKSIEPFGAQNNYKIKFYNDLTNVPLQINNKYKIDLLFRRQGTTNSALKLNCNSSDLSSTYIWNSHVVSDPQNYTSTVTSIGPDYIIINDLFLNSTLVSPVNEIRINRTSFEPAEFNSGEPLYIFGPNELISGQLVFPSTLGSSGGGIRVKKIELDSDNSIRSTNYEYENGTTSYEPLGIQLPVNKISPDFPTCVKNRESYHVENFNSATYYKDIFGKFFELFSVARELPAPGVMYEFVRSNEKIFDKISSTVVDLPGKSEYQFEVYTPDAVNVNRSVLGGTSSVVFGYTNNSATYYTNRGFSTIEDFSSRIGSLKRFTLYDLNGNKVNETRNEYLHDGIPNTTYKNLLNQKFKNQGLLTETFVDARNFLTAENNTILVGVISQKIKYPLLQIASVQQDYKTGTIYRNKNVGFDFYSGEVTKSLSNDAVGNFYLTEVTPAYRKYNSMGLSISGGKNMLTQQAASSIFKVANDATYTKLALVSASAQTWSDQVPVLASGSGGTNAPQTGVWRQRSSYNFIGDENVALRTDGLYPFATFNEFTDWTGNTVTPNWQKLSEIKLFDTYSHALEATDLNGNFAATKMSLDQTRVFATASNAQYNEFAFSGLEETEGQSGALGGGVKLNGTVVSGTAHTGSFSASATLNTKGFSYTFNNTGAKKYHISVWANRSDAVLKLNTTIIPTTFTQAGSWYLIEGDWDIAFANNIEISCEARNATTLFDDFRVHPLKAAMVSYVYSQWGELKWILDNNNLFTEYEYDGMGRLTKVYKETFLHGRTKTSETVYHYAN